MKKILIIQTAFIGDVILSTALLENLHKRYPNAQIDFLLRKGNEGLFKNHPFVNEVIIWDKKKGKIKNLFGVISKLRRTKYDLLINLQRFFSSGFASLMIYAKEKRGFKKNPFSIFYSKSYIHEIGNDENSPHEIERNHSLVRDLTGEDVLRPKLYPDNDVFSKVKLESAYITISPASVWFTKQVPVEKWLELIKTIPRNVEIFLLGAASDKKLCMDIIEQSSNSRISTKAGEYSLLESAAFMKNAKMNFVNDSAPMHLASAMNAPVTAVYCSTIPNFGFGPLSDDSTILETEKRLPCRPCGITGKATCPLGHFACSEIDMSKRKFTL